MLEALAVLLVVVAGILVFYCWIKLAPMVPRAYRIVWYISGILLGLGLVSTAESDSSLALELLGLWLIFTGILFWAGMRAEKSAVK